MRYGGRSSDLGPEPHPRLSGHEFGMSLSNTRTGHPTERTAFRKSCSIVESSPSPHPTSAPLPIPSHGPAGVSPASGQTVASFSSSSWQVVMHPRLCAHLSWTSCQRCARTFGAGGAYGRVTLIGCAEDWINPGRAPGVCWLAVGNVPWRSLGNAGSCPRRGKNRQQLGLLNVSRPEIGRAHV